MFTKIMFIKKIDQSAFDEVTNDLFDLVQEDDFNPDTVMCYGMDSLEVGFDSGLKIGLACGLAILSTITVGYFTCKHVFKKKGGAK